MNQDLIKIYKTPPNKPFNIQINSFDNLVKLMQPLLDLHQIDLKFQRKNCKRSGAAQLKINRHTGMLKYTILIDNDCLDYAKCNIFIHELMHILLDHLVAKRHNKYYLPKKACEFVVDYIAEAIILNLSGKYVNDYKNEYLKMNQNYSYRKLWIETARLNERQINLIKKQIDYGILLLSEYIEEQYENRF